MNEKYEDKQKDEEKNENGRQYKNKKLNERT
jgi:hypothetical protein